MNTFCMLSSSEETSTKFVLRGINPSQLDKQYILNDLQEIGVEQLSESLTTYQDPMTRLTTSLEFVSISKTKSKPYETIVVNDINFRLFVSPSLSLPNTKTDQDYQQTLQDIKTMKRCFCWYCRHSIPSDWHPLGIPLNFKQDEQLFECEGIFCSFNCMLGYLHERNDYRYKDSTVLIGMMYRKIFGVVKKVTDIIASPSWKLLKEYGGHLSIEDYRKCLQVIDYKTLFQVVKNNKLKFQPVSEIFVEV